MTTPRLPQLPPPGNRWINGLASAHLGAGLDLPAIAAGDSNEIESLLGHVSSLIQQANRDFFRFALTAAIDDDEPTPLTLRAGDALSAHGIGLTADASTRKLSGLFVTQVTGGPARIVLPLAGKSVEITAGDAVLWPSFLDAVVDLESGNLEHDDGTVDVLAFHVFGPAFC
jgi:hypothetical protein